MFLLTDIKTEAIPFLNFENYVRNKFLDFDFLSHLINTGKKTLFSS
jgi:hypothetical protein